MGFYGFEVLLSLFASYSDTNLVNTTIFFYVVNQASRADAVGVSASAKALTPAVVAKYFFNKPGDKVRPYLGLGVSHVSFRNVSANLDDAEVKAFAGNGASLSSSWAPVYNAGMIYNLDDKWSINGSMSYIPIKTTVTFSGSGAGAGVTTTGDLKINTTLYVVRLGYHF